MVTLGNRLEGHGGSPSGLAAWASPPTGDNLGPRAGYLVHNLLPLEITLDNGNWLDLTRPATQLGSPNGHYLVLPHRIGILQFSSMNEFHGSCMSKVCRYGGHQSLPASSSTPHCTSHSILGARGFLGNLDDLKVIDSIWCTPLSIES